MASIPAGRNGVDHIKSAILEGSDDEAGVVECIQECCKLGPNLCQYVWIFTGKCFAVGCTEENAHKCAPLKVSTLESSVYASIQYPSSSSSFSSQEQTVPGAVHATIAPLPAPTTPPLQGLTSPPLPGLTTPPLPGLITAHTTKATPPATPPTKGHQKKLAISFAGEWNITLPTSSTHLYSATWPRPRAEQKFLYKWEMVSGPSEGARSGIDKKDLELSGLVAGVYVLKLSVSSWLGVGLGEAVTNVTVHSPVRKNTPPVPVISPSSHTLVLPLNSAIFDATSSHDDLDSVTLHYHWEEVTGPVDSAGVSSDSAVLELTDLKQGNYKYQLKVTDADGLSAVAYATVTVNPEQYYPPQASAGKDQLLMLPNDETTLDGSKSTSFKGELQYSWEKLLGPGAVDLRGTNTPTLQLHISTTGDYLFRLTVTDSRGQASTANVSVVVLPEHNLPPEAIAGGQLSVAYPQDTAVLNGSQSNDDYRIEGWAWTQLSGPRDDVALSGANTSLLKVTGLHIDQSTGSPTYYEFQLLVWDSHNLTATDNVTIQYRKDPKVPPHVSAGGAVSITLPQNTAILNGSSSHDDFGIKTYHWQRSETSPASGLVMKASDQQPLLVLSGLVEGTYNYTLTVTSTTGTVGSDTATLRVAPNPLDDFLLQVHVAGEAATFSLAKQRQLERVLSLILDTIDVDYDIVVEEIRPVGPHIMVEFYALRRDNHTPINATLAYMTLTEKGQDYYYPNSNFHFVKIHMKVCQLPCSGRGSCDRRTHKCSCSRYWMENPFKAHFGRKVTNCEWSIFYVALASLLGVAALLFVVWLTCCCCMRRRRRARANKRVRYAILDRKEKEERRQILPRGDSGYQQTSLMVSESSETEEEILFETNKDKIKNGNGVQIRTNGGVRMGSSLS